jgi:hypothetical protein
MQSDRHVVRRKFAAFQKANFPRRQAEVITTMIYAPTNGTTDLDEGDRRRNGRSDGAKSDGRDREPTGTGWLSGRLADTVSVRRA